MRAPFWRGPAFSPAGPRWLDVPSNRAWFEELQSAIDAGEVDRVVAAQAALRLPVGERPSLLQAAAGSPPPGPQEAARGAGWEVQDTRGPATVAGPARRPTGAYARRAAKETG